MGTQADDTHLSEMGALEPSSVIPGWKIGIPLIRLFACGPFTIEVLHEVPAGNATQARYAPLPPERLHGRGPAPALTFLKLLTSQADRYAPKDWLIEHLRGDDYLITPKRLENIVSFVRQLLSLPDGTRPAGMLRYVRASHESGDGYRLAPYPLIWLDVDALAHTVRQACLLERFGDDPLPQWERAYQLASRGTYLSEEPYSEWAEVRREEVEGHLRQCVHALARLWLARQGEAAEEEVLHLLRGYWPRHPEDEDVAWGLMDLLGRRGRYQEALDIFACLEQSLEEQGLTKEGKPRVPDQRTRDLADYLRLKERQPLISRPSQWEPAPSSSVGALVQRDGIAANPSPVIAIPGYDGMLSHFSHAVTQGIREAVLTAHQSLALPLTFWEMPSDDAAMGMWVARSAALLGPLLDASWSFDALIEPLRIIVPVVKAMPMMTRRTFLQAGAATAMLGGLPLLNSKQISEEETMQFCQAFSESTTAGWRLFTQGKNAQALTVSQAQLMLLQHMSAALPVRERPKLYASVYQLMGMGLCNQGHFHAALDAHSRAYIAALGAGDMFGVAYGLLGQANSYFVLAQHKAAIETVQQALHVLGALDGPSLHIKAHLLGVWADSAMSAGDYETAHQKLDAIAALLDDLSPNEEFDRANWYQLLGKYAYFTGDYAAAENWCEQAWQELPEASIIRRALALMPLLAVNTIMQDLDASLLTLEKVRQIIPALQASAMNHPLQQGLQGFLIVFPHETRVKTIVSDLVQYLR